MLGDNPERDAEELLGIVQVRDTLQSTMQGIQLADVTTEVVPVKTINHKTYYCILMNKETVILSSAGMPILFDNKTYEYALGLAKELQATLKRADRVLSVAQMATLTTVTIVRRKPKRKLTKRELSKRKFENAKQDSLRDSTKQGEVGGAPELEVPPVSSDQHISNEGEQSCPVYELPSNNNNKQSEGE